MNGINDMFFDFMNACPYLFVIDTNSYTDNFRRDLTAYITGEFGEDDMLKEEYAFNLRNQFPEFHSSISKIIINDSSIYGSCCFTYPTPGRFDDGYNKCWNDDSDESTVVKDRNARISSYCNQQMGFYERRIINSAIGVDVSSFEKAIESYKQLRNENIKSTLEKMPAYESVAIPFDSAPTQEQIDFMKERAIQFFKEEYKSNVSIVGFRLVKNVIITDWENI